MVTGFSLTLIPSNRSHGAFCIEFWYATSQLHGLEVCLNPGFAINSEMVLSL
ncbi:MAG: DUF645 family protein [Thaumarchaeota archaeon]|nr:DUF645 family protein [Nitrososphaerota archaeon]